jgi:ferredoxin-NADP reductase/CRP-like cAMP-binding protein
MDYTPEVLIRRTNLFNALSAEELQALIRSALPVEYPAGALIMREGEIGHELYLIQDGIVQVFTTAPDGEEVVLARWESGSYFGEQALLPGGSGQRTASVRAVTDVIALKIRKEDFQRVLAKDSPLKERLVQTGEAQVRNKLLKQSAIFRSLPVQELADENWHHEEHFEDGQIVFREGDPGTQLYLILSGSAGVYKADEGSQKLLARIGEGQCFGELALIKREPRRATIIAQGPLRVLSIDGEKFMSLYERNPDLREYMQTLQKVYTLSGQGFVTQHAGKFLGFDAITTLYHLGDGTTAVVSTVVGESLYNMTLVLEGEPQRQVVRYEAADQGVERELQFVGDLIVGMTVKGQWEELGKVQRLALERRPIEGWQKAAFRTSGSLQIEIPLPRYEDSEIVCDCLQVRRGTLRQVIEQGGRTVEDLVEATGASTVCGSCKVRLQEMVGQSSWTPVMLSEMIDVSPDIRTFRWVPYQGNLKPAMPAQHIVIQAHIDGKWVERPYTISSPATETGYREITVKREPQGYFSRWLFEQRRDDALIRISDPQGNYYADLARPNPIVCFVAGIGVTPALAICRTVIREGFKQRLHVDYSVSLRDQFAYADEFREAASKHDNIDLTLRVTKEDGRITPEHVKKLVNDYPQAEFYICGPHAFQTTVEKYLVGARVPQKRIHIEEFTPVGGKAAAAAKAATPSRTYVYVGLALFAAFALQDLLGLKWPWLEAVQAGESYKRWSGLALTGFMAAQWYLPLLRAQGKLRESARFYPLHKYLGVLAPLFFFIHSTRFGYAYLLMLSSVFFANIVLGIFNKELVSDPERRKTYSQYWMILHVTLSVLTVSLLIYHIFMAFYYD